MIDLFGDQVKEKVEEEKYKRKTVSLFDWLNDLNYEKKNLFNDSTEQDFSTFMINRGMSQNIETVMLANELNKHYNVTKQMAHDFYFYLVPAKKRYSKWAKQSNDYKDTLDLLVKHYKVNKSRAVEYMKILTAEEIEQIRKLNDVGGKSR
jgi:hypothetical protein